jgi:hypothetical protein
VAPQAALMRRRARTNVILLAMVVLRVRRNSGEPVLAADADVAVADDEAPKKD